MWFSEHVTLFKNDYFLKFCFVWRMERCSRVANGMTLSSNV